MCRKLVGLWVCLLLVAEVSAWPVRVLQRVDDKEECALWVESRLSRMTLKQKIGQLFIHTVPPVLSQRNRENIRSAVEDYGVGGLLFSGGDLNKQVQLTDEARKMAEVPLLVAFDGEWGLAMRLKNTPGFPKNRVLGCIQNDTLLYLYGREVARQLREIGVQVNFAPVADVDNNPDNPVINVRSFGSNPQEVARKVVAYSRGLEDGGVLAVCKHFPGHGDTDVDSHHALPVLDFTRERLDSIELYPFRRAAEAGVGGMMVGHLQVPALGSKPASVSSGIIKEVLRDGLHFEGLVFTDALEMKGISDAAGDLCARALMAGNDLLLAPRNLKRELAGVLKAVKDGRLSESEITEKCRKVLTYKYALGLDRQEAVALDGLPKRIHTAGTDSIREELDKAAVVVLKDSAGMLPLDLSLSGTVLLSIAPDMSQAAPFYQELKEAVPLAWMHARADSLAQIRKRLRPAQRVIVAVHQREIGRFRPLIEEMAADKPLFLVCFARQDVLEKMPSAVRKAAGVILAHADKSHIQRHVAGIMTGKSRADARLSVGISSLFRSGEGVTIDPDCPRSYTPEDFGMDSSVLARIDDIAREGIRGRAYPGCHVLILKDGYPIYNKCFGRFTYGNSPEVKENDLYDLASLSKVTGTLLAVMKLYDEGKIGLTDRVSRYLPALRGTNKEDITVQELLYHESGIAAYLPFYREAIDLKTCKNGLFRKRFDANHRFQVAPSLYACTCFKYRKEWVSPHPSDTFSLRIADSLYLNKAFRGEVVRQIIESPVKSRSFRYSCLNFMLLKEMAETVTGVPMDVYLDSVFYRPMGLVHTAYNPLDRFSREQIVPTVEADFLRGGPVQGIVHDEAAAFMGGVSGNAGLFSTARDVATIFQMLLDRGVCGGRRYLSRATCDLFVGMKSKNSRRGLGFDKPDTENEKASLCAAEAPASVFGHTGFTGTCAWADPDNGLVFVFLCNRTYPRVCGNNGLSRLKIRQRIQQAMYQSLKK